MRAGGHLRRAFPHRNLQPKGAVQIHRKPGGIKLIHQMRFDKTRSMLLFSLQAALSTLLPGNCYHGMDFLAEINSTQSYEAQPHSLPARQ